MPPRKRCHSPEPENGEKKLERRRQINRDSARRARDRQNVDLKVTQQKIIAYNKENTNIRYLISQMNKELAMLKDKLKNHTCVKAQCSSSSVATHFPHDVSSDVISDVTSSDSVGYIRQHGGSESSAASSSSSGEYSETDTCSHTSITLDEQAELDLIDSVFSGQDDNNNNNSSTLQVGGDVAGYTASDVTSMCSQPTDAGVVIPSPDYSGGMPLFTSPLDAVPISYNYIPSLPVSVPSTAASGAHALLLPPTLNTHGAYLPQVSPSYSFSSSPSSSSYSSSPSSSSTDVNFAPSLLGMVPAPLGDICSQPHTVTHPVRSTAELDALLTELKSLDGHSH